MFYTISNIVIINSYLLSAYAPIPEERKFTKQIKFREALCKTLFTHLTNAVASAGNITIIANKAAITGVKINHHRVSMKRAPYVIYKQGARERKKDIKNQQEYILLVISPNVVSRSKNRHIARATTGYSSY